MFRRVPNRVPRKGEQAAQPTLEVNTERRSAHEIFEGALENARKELRRSSRALAFSGLAGGITMGLTGMSVAIAETMLRPSPVHDFIAYLFYPIGFIAVIIGRAQLFTENTLFPVVLVLTEHKYVRHTARLWAVVYVANLLGALVFALLVTKTGALRADFLEQLVTIGTQSVQLTAGQAFWTGVVGGWLIALVAWMVTASHWTIGQIMVVWFLTFLVGVGHFAHCIATSGEILVAILGKNLSFANYIRWLVPATLGNIVGGVFIVSLLNWGQVKAGGEEEP